MAEINVTPFVDVMLVLLIVFMVTAPLADGGRAGRSAQDASARRWARTASRCRSPSARTARIFLQNTPVADDDLVPRLTAISANGYDQRIFVRGDKSVDYGRVMEVMAMISAAGFTHIGLVTDVAKPTPDKN